MPSDIVVSIRYNDISKIRKSKVENEDNITWRIKEVMEEFEKQIKDITTEVVEIDDDEQKAMDIGSDILRLIDIRAQEKVDEIRLCRG